MPTAQTQCPHLLGFRMHYDVPPNYSSFNLNAALNWEEFSFYLPEAKTLNTVMLYCRALTGALAATDIQCDIWSETETSNVPLASLASTTTVSPAMAAGTWVTFSGFSLALTNSERYWVVLKNNNATPASNYCAFQTVYSVMPSVFSITTGYNSYFDWKHKTSTNGAAGFSGDYTSGVAYGGLRLGFSDGTYAGLPVGAPVYQTGVNAIYGTREAGAQFRTPATGVLKVRGAWIMSYRMNSNHLLRYKLYLGNPPVLLGTTASFGNLNISTTGGTAGPLYFSAPLTVPPGSLVTLVGSEEANSDSSSAYYSFTEVPVHDDANSKALLPFGGISRAYYNGSTWSFDSTRAPFFGLLLDTDTPFGERIIVPAGMSGGMGS